MGYTAAGLAEYLNSPLLGDGSLLIEGPGDLQEPSPGVFVYASDTRTYRRALSLKFDLILTRKEPDEVYGAVILVPEPARAFNSLLRLVAAARAPRLMAGIHPSAQIAPSASVPASTAVGPFVVIGEGVRLAKDCRLAAGVVLGDGVRLGEGVSLAERVVVHPDVSIGAGVAVGAGTVIGGAGFGFEATPSGGWASIPQLGGVRIEAGVSIGANCTIDRGTAGDTVIGAGSHLDNQVHIAHNVRLGPDNLVLAQTGLAGSVISGAGCVFGGQVGVADHCRIGDGVVIGSKSGVQSHRLRSGIHYWGNPARPMEEGRRINASMSRLPGLLREWREWKKERE